MLAGLKNSLKNMFAATKWFCYSAMIKQFLGTKPTEHATKVLGRAEDEILKDTVEIYGTQLGLINCNITTYAT